MTHILISKEINITRIGKHIIAGKEAPLKPLLNLVGSNNDVAFKMPSFISVFVSQMPQQCYKRVKKK